MAGVCPEALERRAVVVATDAGVQRHHEPVVARHPRHLEEHVAAEGDRLGVRGITGERRTIDARRLRGLERIRAHVLVAVVGRGRPERDEVPAALFKRADVAGVVAGVDAGALPHPRDRIAPAGLRGLQVGVGTEGRDDAARPLRVGGQRSVRAEVRAGIVRGRENLQPEALVQGTGPECVPGEPLGDVVVDRVGGLRRRAQGDVEDLGQLGLEPEPDGRAPQDRPALAQHPPHPPRRLLRERFLPDAQLVQPGAVGVQQPRHVVIGRDEQRRRVGERVVLQQPQRVDVPVGRDQRQIAHRCVEAPGDRPLRRVGRQQPVRVQREDGLGAGHAPVL